MLGFDSVELVLGAGAPRPCVSPEPEQLPGVRARVRTGRVRSGSHHDRTVDACLGGRGMSRKRTSMSPSPMNRRVRLANDESRQTALLATVTPTAPALIVLEATGGYKKTLATTVALAGLPGPS